MADTALMTILENRIARWTFGPSFGQETSGQAGGQIRVRTTRAPLWKLSMDCDPLWRDEAAAVKALIGSMGQSVGSFLAWDIAWPYPKADPTGALISGSTVQIKSLGSDGTSLALKGLPVGYVLTRGDYLGFTYSTTKKALHQVVAATVTADGSGDTAEFAVHPAIRTGAAVNDAVSLSKPCAEFRIVPGSYDFSSAGAHDQLSLEALQVV